MYHLWCKYPYTDIIVTFPLKISRYTVLPATQICSYEVGATMNIYKELIYYKTRRLIRYPVCSEVVKSSIYSVCTQSQQRSQNKLLHRTSTCRHGGCPEEGSSSTFVSSLVPALWFRSWEPIVSVVLHNSLIRLSRRPLHVPLRSGL